MSIKDPIVYDCTNFPAVSFGDDIVREVRLIAAPETTGEERIRIVMSTLPAGAATGAHAHPDADEYILFNISGKIVLDDLERDVPANGLVHVLSGVAHECINTDPEKTLNLFCVFVPAFEPYGSYPDLIAKTKKYLNGSN